MRKIKIRNICFNIPFLKESINPEEITYVEGISYDSTWVRQVYERNGLYYIKSGKGYSDSKELILKKGGKIANGPSYEIKEWKRLKGPELRFDYR